MLRSPDLRPDANELTAIGSDSLTYDASGNLISRVESGGSTWSYEYDAWNRLVKVVVTPSGESAEDRAEFRYNALNHRAWRHVDTSSPPDGTLDERTRFYYDAVWRIIEEHVETGGSPTWTAASTLQRVWGPMGTDEMLLHRRDTDAELLVAMLTIATDTVTDAVDRVLRFFEDH